MYIISASGWMEIKAITSTLKTPRSTSSGFSCDIMICTLVIRPMQMYHIIASKSIIYYLSWVKSIESAKASKAAGVMGLKSGGV